MPTKALSCIVCGRELLNVTFFKDAVNQPSGGTTFRTRGHYGSTVFDDMGRTELMINICDVCMTAKARQGLILHVTPSHAPPPPSTYKTWQPYTGEDEDDGEDQGNQGRPGSGTS